MIFLIGNKIDKKNVVDTQVKMLLNSPIGGFISYFETSLQDKEGQKLIIEKIALKIQSKTRDKNYFFLFSLLFSSRTKRFVL